MIIANYEVIRQFSQKHARAKTSLATWYEFTLRAKWKKFDDVKKDFRSADIYKKCVIFNIGGNNYRLIANINYRAEIVYILTVMTHAEYDKEKWKGNC